MQFNIKSFAKKHGGKLGAAAVLGGLVVGGMAGGAQAAATAFGDEGSVYHYHINDQVEADLMKTPNGSVYHSSLNNGIVDVNNLAPTVKGQLTFGQQVGFKDVPPTTIANIGGKFTERATNAGTISVPAGGLYEIRGQYRIERTVNGGNDILRPQVALRYGTDLKDAGTAMGVEISRQAGRELVGATYGQVDTRQATGLTEVTVYFFGYTDNGSSMGSGELKGSGSFKVVRVG